MILHRTRVAQKRPHFARDASRAQKIDRDDHRLIKADRELSAYYARDINRQWCGILTRVGSGGIIISRATCTCVDYLATFARGLFVLPVAFARNITSRTADSAKFTSAE